MLLLLLLLLLCCRSFLFENLVLHRIEMYCACVFVEPHQDEHFSLGASAMRPTQSQGEVPTTHSVHAHRKELETIVQQVSDDELADGLW